MSAQRVTQEELDRFCGVLDRMAEAGIEFTEGKTCFSNMVILDLRDLRRAMWAVAQFPITHPAENQDAANMAALARAALEETA